MDVCRSLPLSVLAVLFMFMFTGEFESKIHPHPLPSTTSWISSSPSPVRLLSSLILSMAFDRLPQLRPLATTAIHPLASSLGQIDICSSSPSPSPVKPSYIDERSRRMVPRAPRRWSGSVRPSGAGPRPCLPGSGLCPAVAAFCDGGGRVAHIRLASASGFRSRVWPMRLSVPGCPRSEAVGGVVLAAVGGTRCWAHSAAQGGCAAPAASPSGSTTTADNDGDEAVDALVFADDALGLCSGSLLQRCGSHGCNVERMQATSWGHVSGDPAMFVDSSQPLLCGDHQCHMQD
ncbi:unnamed protein product [Miscanthus lutarioriparius]|uniref:Uncharacterized protein n=1 Tax=Miscanthus lutarioriparius TaxID=422564 RepID=A0A811N7E6_9POAL|nr:unnamed protein product [Miscanthus lutarioriparius]